MKHDSWLNRQANTCALGIASAGAAVILAVSVNWGQVGRVAAQSASSGLTSVGRLNFAPALAFLLAVQAPTSQGSSQLSAQADTLQLERIGQLRFDHGLGDLWVHAGFAYLKSRVRQGRVCGARVGSCEPYARGRPSIRPRRHL